MEIENLIVLEVDMGRVLIDIQVFTIIVLLIVMTTIVGVIIQNITNNLLDIINTNPNIHLGNLRSPFPPFYGTTGVDDYLSWEMKVKYMFECHQVDHERRVTL